MNEIITNHLDLWTSALLTKSSAGRGSNGKLEAYGIKKLRELILELAVRGKLVPQHPNDEPATELLKRVAADKARMVKEGIARKEKGFPPIAEDEIPFKLPEGWGWARINDVGHDWGQKTPDATFTYIDVSAIDNSSGVITSPTVLSASDAPSRARKIVKRGTVIYSTVRPYLKNICVIEEDYEPEPIASTAFAILHPLQGMPGRFFAFYFRSPEFVKYVESVQTGIAYPAINDKQFYGGLVPVPPLAEQHRIVAKVDELMALCDQLEQQQTHSLEAHQTLVETLLGTLVRPSSVRAELRARRAVEARPSTVRSFDKLRTNGSGRAEFEEAWARIATHFDTLFTTEHSIDQLKQTILQLAVMGKLVPQDPNDEPASKLLVRIEDEKRQLIQAGQIRVKDRAVPIAEEESPFEMPAGWKWVRLSDIARRIHYGYTASAKPEIESVRLLRITDIQDNVVDWSSVPGCEIEGSDLPQYQLVGGDILVARTGGTVGKTYLVSEIPVVAVFASYLIRIQAASALFVRYLKLFLESPTYWEQLVEGARGGAQPNVNGQTLGKMIVPLPPEPEQHRIVAKVDELMALCDVLKARIKDAQTTQVHLADAIVEQAVA